MISILCYGRNDDYASGLQKRAALSLNALARHLDQNGDEIVFVDYNGADALPTFPEAIADTLTPETRRKIRVIRVRPAYHRRLARVGDPPVMEAVARNIGLRRTAPGNRWVLSTNSDVVPIGDGGPSLSARAATLADGHYGAPRYELPALLWTLLDRRDATAAAARIVDWARTLRLDEIVRHPDPAIGFDAPGDFQLALRADLLAIAGFDERMRRGWHVDSNLARRLAMLRGDVRVVPDGPRIYHCEHTRLSSAKHAGGRGEDAAAAFFDAAAGPVPPGQEHEWGAPDAAFECFALETPPSAALPAALARQIADRAEPGADATSPPEALYGPASFDAPPRREAHMATHVVDALAGVAPDARIAWFCGETGLAALVAAALAAAGRPDGVMIPGEAVARAGIDAPLRRVDGMTALRAADVIVIDFPGAEAPEAMRASVWEWFGLVVRDETRRQAGGAEPRSIVAVNAIHNLCETAVLAHMDCVLAPFTTRLRCGRVRPRPAGPVPLLDALTPGTAGVRAGGRIASAPGVQGHVFFGPYVRPAPGRYRAHVALAAKPGPRSRLVLEAGIGALFLAQREVAMRAAPPGDLELVFEAPPSVVRPDHPGLELRLWTDGSAALVVEGVSLCAED